jgi:hypothetical protein
MSVPIDPPDESQATDSPPDASDMPESPDSLNGPQLVDLEPAGKETGPVLLDITPKGQAPRRKGKPSGKRRKVVVVALVGMLLAAGGGLACWFPEKGQSLVVAVRNVFGGQKDHKGTISTAPGAEGVGAKKADPGTGTGARPVTGSTAAGEELKHDDSGAKESVDRRDGEVKVDPMPLPKDEIAASLARFKVQPSQALSEKDREELKRLLDMINQSSTTTTAQRDEMRKKMSLLQSVDPDGKDSVVQAAIDLFDTAISDPNLSK